MSSTRRHVTILIIGSGIAGCTAALTLADAGRDVLLINAGPDLDDGNTPLAQGGIIYKAADTPRDAEARALEHDILVAGHRYNNNRAVRFLCRQGPDCVDNMLIERAGVDFDRNEDGTYNLTREGGHGAHRILHKADYSGRALMDGLAAQVKIHPRITCLHNHSAIDLLTTLHSTNAPGCVGAGISMAFRAGVELANLEFMQFHPTALYEERSYRRPLITEAMRGEGARLLDDRGEAFMLRHDKRGDLAPRDVVAQAMVEEMLRRGVPCLYLDVSGVKQDLPTRFPTVFNQCLEIGIDIRKEPIPVVPAAHYFCGGILTDTFGRTSMPGLYAIGECACTGLHGANRLASTSLLEAAVWGQSCGQHLARITASGREAIPRALAAAIPDWRHEGNEHHDDPALVAQDWANIRNTMWNYVGISRSKARLRRAFEDMRDLVRHIHDFYKGTRISKPLVDLFHGSQTAYVITQAAMRNKNSIGCHHRVD